MKVTFVHFLVDVMPSYSHAIASLASVLSSLEHKVALVNARESKFENTIKEILDTRPDVVCMSFMSNQWLTATSLAHELKQHRPELPLWAGGSHINADPASFYGSEFDGACYGEGEGILPLVLESHSNGQTFYNQSWITKYAESYASSAMPYVVEDLDSLPLPLVELFDRADVLNYPSVMFSRGCPFKCTYCMSRMGGIGQMVRWKSVNRAIKETARLVDSFKPDEIYFDDDTFLKNPKWVKAFLQEYRSKVSLPYYCNARPEVVTQELCKLLANTGCTAIGIGIENGSEYVRREILGRSMSNSVIQAAFDLAHAAGLRTWSFNMVGVPGETVERLQETISLNREVNTDFVRVSVFTPYPGTPLSESTGALVSPISYFKSLDSLDEDLRSVAEKWILELRSQGRLWNDESFF